METPDIEPPHKSILEQMNDMAERRVRELATDLVDEDFADSLFPESPIDPLEGMRQVQGALRQIELVFPGPRVAELSGNIDAMYAEMRED